ncbi:MAG: GNAT family N-acetyltransferase [Erysipelotrichaceae bacterium]|nr:GNAT family N-acetyltransferase [Erysipelotrichaceae bacterium]
MEFVRLENDEKEIERMSAMATAIVREHFDPLIGKEQNDYMLSLFQTPGAIAAQLAEGYRYYFVRKDGEDIGFTAFYPRQDAMYLSKFYLYRQERAKGYAHAMMEFVESETRKEGLQAVELNVNRFNSAVQVYEKLGFEIIREEKNEIGHGFIMDDYVFRKQL